MCTVSIVHFYIKLCCPAISCSLPEIQYGNYTWADSHARLPLYGENVTLTCVSGFVVNRTGCDATAKCIDGRKLDILDDICVGEYIYVTRS